MMLLDLVDLLCFVVIIADVMFCVVGDYVLLVCVLLLRVSSAV